MECLGLLPGKVKSIPVKRGYNIPHMGWNQLDILKPNSITNNIPQNSYVYFVHSYYAELSSCCIASTDYHINMSAIVATQGVWGCQFHPERSGVIGAKILENFCQYTEKKKQMKFIPAIDILGGRCVRLLKGNYNHVTDFGNLIDIAQNLEKTRCPMGPSCRS